MEFSRCARRDAPPARKPDGRPLGTAGIPVSQSSTARSAPKEPNAGVDVVSRRVPAPDGAGCAPSTAGTPAAVGAAAFPRKEVIQPQLPLRLPCYDFTPITDST